MRVTDTGDKYPAKAVCPHCHWSVDSELHID